LRLNAKYQLLNFQGEPDLRGEPAASGADNCLQGCGSQSGVERSDKKKEATQKNDGLRKQAVEV
jgi:hypothetical protein